MTESVHRDTMPAKVRLSTCLRHMACVVMLMWTGIVNGQPFFFPDTTNYIRAADMAVYVASGRTISTVWTDRYRSALRSPSGPARDPADGAKVPDGNKRHATANNIGAGLVMSGRSPYIGALMYAGWVIGWFWPFVLLQAVISYYLIILTLRRFGLDHPRTITIVTAIMALTTSLPTYNSLLLADGFAAFGILAFILLALPGRLERWQVGFLVVVLFMATISHLTHLMMLLGMAAVAGLLALFKVTKPQRRGWIAAATGVVIAIVALQATTIAVRKTVGKEPQLLPLMTARFYMDGPGKAFIEAGCDGGRFEVCRVPIDRPEHTGDWLFSTSRETGAYLLASTDSRRVMGEQDVSFAIAVLRAYPLQQIGMAAWNTVRQFARFPYYGLNQGCWDRASCWNSLPDPVRSRLKGSLSGRNLWPGTIMNAILHVVVIGSVIALVLVFPEVRRRRPEVARMLGSAVIITLTAMIVCSFFGGAVAEPQYRYQGRLIWLTVLFGMIGVLLWRQTRGRSHKSVAFDPSFV